MSKHHVVTVVGGGASAHTLIPFLAGAGHRVQLLTRQPDKWAEEIEVQEQSTSGDVLRTIRGRLAMASSDPAAVIPQSDVVVLCMPVHAYRQALHHLAPHLDRDREVSIGTIYGQAGFNWMVDEIGTEHGLDNVTTFAFGLIPWICRIREYGRVGINYGCKEVNVAAVSPHDRFADLNRTLLPAICEQWMGKGGVRQSDNFLSLTLSVDNQIIHPTRCYGLFISDGGQWKNQEDIPYFYRDYDELSADLLRDLDTDYSKVRDGIRQRFPDRDFRYMLDYLSLERLSYGTENTDIRESFVTSKTLGSLKPPTRRLDSGEWGLDTDNRFFTDDITYGICIAKWMAEQMDLSVPTMDALIEWAQALRGDTYLVGGRLQTEHESLAGRFRSGIPPVYGLTTLEEAVAEKNVRRAVPEAAVVF